MSLLKKHRTIYKAILIAFFISIVFLSALLLFYFINPIEFRLTIFQPVREFFFITKELGLPQNWSNTEKIIIPPAKKIEIPSDDYSKLRIVADLRLPSQEQLSPALLLLHGSSPWGRKNGLVVLLSHRFQSAGWVTLLPDARGFGETDDPHNIKIEDSWSVKNDIQRCLNFLLTHPRTDPERIYIMGHSMGATHALEGALNDNRVKAIVLISPNSFPNGVKVGLWRRTRFSADRRLKHLVPEDVVRSLTEKSDFSYFIKAHSQNNADLPILLLMGQYEGEKKITYSNNFAFDSDYLISFHILKRAGHYLGVYNLFGSDTIFFRSDLFNPSLALMLEFFKQIESRN